MFNFLKKTPVTDKPLPSEHFLHDAIIDKNDIYIRTHTLPVNMISVFDDVRFDRSDIDNLSPGMYRYISKCLKELGFKQDSGRTFSHNEFDIRCEIPKSRVQGSSPFHVLDYTPKREQDFYILTPTQVAGVMISRLPHADAVPLLVDLVEHHPINLFKLKDHLDSSQNHQDFLNVVAHLKYKQREAASKQPLIRVKTLK